MADVDSVQGQHLPGKSTPKPDSKSSECERIAAVRSMVKGDVPPETGRLSLQHMMADAHGQEGYWREVWARCECHSVGTLRLPLTSDLPLGDVQFQVRDLMAPSYHGPLLKQRVRAFRFSPWNVKRSVAWLCV
jgi:hypothetical protein